MFSILREFYFGNVSPSENLNPKHPLYKECNKLANDLETVFMKKLSDEKSVAKLRRRSCNGVYGRLYFRLFVL